MPSIDLATVMIPQTHTHTHPHTQTHTHTHTHAQTFTPVWSKAINRECAVRDLFEMTSGTLNHSCITPLSTSCAEDKNW